MPETPTGETRATRNVLVGDLEWLEFAIADYVVKWGQHLDGIGPDIAGTPVAVANMAMTVVRRNLVPSEDEVLRVALRACWDRFSDLMPDDLYEQVRAGLHLLEFADVSDIEEGSEFDGPNLV